MRVAHINDVASVGSTLVAELRRVGVDATLIQPHQPAARWRHPWKLATYPVRLASLVGTAFEIRRRRFDLVHIHYARLAILGELARLPYVIHCHGTDIRGVDPRSPWGRLMRPAFDQAALVYYATPDLAAWVRPFRPNAEFLPNPITVGVGGSTADAAQTRDLLVGVRLDLEKGAPRIERIVHELIRHRPRTSVTIIAQGRYLPRVAASAGTDVETRPRMPHAAMPALLAQHRIVIGQMHLGALGNFELEAMAAGRPVVSVFRFAYAYPDPPPVVDPGSDREAAVRIADLLDDDAQRRAIGESARSWVRANHDAAAIASRVASAYTVVLERG